MIVFESIRTVRGRRTGHPDRVGEGARIEPLVGKWSSREPRQPQAKATRPKRADLMPPHQN
jgi:hypothetical protein